MSAQENPQGLYKAEQPISYGPPSNKNNFLVGLLIKPEAQRLLHMRADREGKYFVELASEFLQSYGFNPVLFKTILHMQEEALLAIYKDTYKPYLDRLALGSADDLLSREGHINFFCKRPLTMVVAELLDQTNALPEDQTVSVAQSQRDRLRTEWGKSRLIGDRIVHRQTPLGAQFSALHAGFIHELSVLITTDDIQLINRQRPNAANAFLRQSLE